MSTFVSFKAGKLQDKEGAAGKFTITPDKRKGQITVLKDAMDQLMRFQWQDRVTRAVVDDIIVMPGDMEFTKVDTGRPQDRVYLLQMKNSTRRFFYWMQDKSADKDAEYLAAVQACLEGKPIPAATGGAAPPAADGLSEVIRSLGSRPAGAAPTAGAPAGQVDLQSLQGILNNMGFAPPQPTGRITAADLQRAMMGIAAPRPRVVPLTEVLSADDVLATGILNDPQVVEELSQLVPEEQPGGAEVEVGETLRSPQLQQALASLTHALQSDNFNSIMSNFGLDANNPDAMAALSRGDGVQALLSALMHAAKQKKDADAAATGGGSGARKPRGKAKKEESSSSVEIPMVAEGQKKLVIVESPAKARTIQTFLGESSGFVIDSCAGHIRDLPSSATQVPAALKKEKWATMGVNVDKDFEPLYIISPGKKAVIDRLKQLASTCDEIILATDEDREGEAISWHLVQALQPKVPVSRAVFHEITREAIARAFATTREIDYALVDAQEARRIIDSILDRKYPVLLAGYTMSPLLWRKIAPKLSAGRVQSVALAMIIKREMARLKFKSAEYWDLNANVTATGQTRSFPARLVSIDGVPVATSKDFDASTGQLKEEQAGQVTHLQGEAAVALRDTLSTAAWRVAALDTRRSRRKPPPPFITSTLQQEGNRKLRLTSKVTMTVAQELYESSVTMIIAQELYESGLITYMRTDNPNLSEEARRLARECTERVYGAEHLASTTSDRANKKPKGSQHLASTTSDRANKKPKCSQEAHEAIRPAVASEGRFLSPPETGLEGVQLGLYQLIFTRTMASVMADAVLDYTTAMLEAEPKAGTPVATFRATGKQVVEPGWLRAYQDTESDAASGGGDEDGASAALADDDALLPPLAEGMPLDCAALTHVERHTKPPARYTEASFVKELEAVGVGRPSTYATILETLKERRYIQAQKSALAPSLSAFVVTRLLERYFPDFVDTQFTARMEEQLDQIARGQADRTAYLKQEQLDQIVRGQAVKMTYLKQYYSGDEGLKAKVDNTEAQIPSEEARRAWLPTLSELDDQVGIFFGPWGAYIETLQPVKAGGDTGAVDGIIAADGSDGSVEEGEKEKLNKCKLPQDLQADVELISVEAIQHCLRLSEQGGLALGDHPVTGETVRLKIGRYGPYVEAGSVRSGLPKNEDIWNLDLDRACQYLNLPRLVTHHPENGKEVKVGIGMYGPYLVCDGNYKSLPASEDVLTIGEPRCLELLEIMEKAKKPLADLGEHHGEKIRVLLGRFGPYIRWNSCNVKVPAEYKADAALLPYDAAVEAIEKFLAAGGGSKKGGKGKKGEKSSKGGGAKGPTAKELGVKSARNPYFLFSADTREELKALGLTKVGDIAKELGARWQAASPEVKAKYEALASEDKLRWAQEMEAALAKLPQSSSTSTGVNGASAKPSKRPAAKIRVANGGRVRGGGGTGGEGGVKSPRTAYILYGSAKRLEAKETGAEGAAVDLKAIARMWKEATPEEKARFEAMAREDKARFQREIEAVAA
ncbi:DNA topoisomerase [Tribonema minus]|uniref:DNA topoisomerase n=1 Tax=Tribonema minus TaxID=303371 RepID=A0A835Z3T3_9STRA|nr:DNA topoisomerase [Tribonema minus]